MECAEWDWLEGERERLIFLYVVALVNLRAAANGDAEPDMILEMVLAEAKFDLDRAQTEIMEHRSSCAACGGSGAPISNRENGGALASLQARVEQARYHCAALQREAGELMRDL